MIGHSLGRMEMCFGPRTLGAGAKTRLNTSKAVTYHEQYHITVGS